MKLPSSIDLHSFLKKLEAYGSLPALTNAANDQTFSYQELVNRIHYTASVLKETVQPGDRVLLSHLSGLEWVVHFFALLLIRAVAVPIDYRMPDHLVSEIISSTQPKLHISFKSATSVKTIQPITYDSSKSHQKFPPAPADSIAEILYTSGTWGHPKGVVLTIRNLMSNLHSVLQVYAPTPSDNILSVLPLSHAYEQMAGLLVPLYSGTHIIYQQSIDRQALLNSFQRYRITKMAVVPRFLDVLRQAILQKAEKSGRAVILTRMLAIATYLPIKIRRLLFRSIHKQLGSRFVVFVVGGAPLSPPVEQFFLNLGIKIMIGYGLTESSPVIAASTKPRENPNSVGNVIPGVEVRIASDGEILARGENISPGYWPLGDSVPPEWLHTGDLGKLEQDGQLILTGRKKHMVIFPNGEKILLEDIEELGREFPGVAECCAVELNDTSERKRIALAYVGQPEETAVKDYINSRLPLFARISTAHRWADAELPKTHTLKLQREEIRRRMG